MTRENRDKLIFWTIVGLCGAIIFGVGIWSMFNVDKW